MAAGFGKEAPGSFFGGGFAGGLEETEQIPAMGGIVTWPYKVELQPRAESIEFKPTPLEQVTGEIWDTVLLDDDDHTYDYVIGMLHAIFGYPHMKCFLLTRQVDTSGRVIVFRGCKKDAEWGRDAILNYGRDPLLERSKGSMKAIIEQFS